VANDRVFDIAGFVFPIVSGTPGQGLFLVDRFIGSGFWVDSKGHFLTCRHVLEAVKENQSPAIAQPFGEQRDRYIPIVQSECHPKFDIAMGTARLAHPSKFLSLYEEHVVPGKNVSAFGFTEWGKSGQSLQIDVRYLKGHITRTSEEQQGLPTPRVVEVSFGSPSGFSGTPLLVDFKIAGMLYSNIETKLQAYSISEVHDGNNEYRETAYRIYEYGLSHQPADLVSFLAQCGIAPFQ
jgi:hypothetical protein